MSCIVFHGTILELQRLQSEHTHIQNCGKMLHSMMKVKTAKEYYALCEMLSCCYSPCSKHRCRCFEGR